MSKVPKLVVIVGETASGKSVLAMELARQFSGEIISADSWQVYPGFNVGTAKPSELERAEIPHHLIDIADPAKGFSAALYKDLANKAISDITSRGNLPIMVGGTGLYVDSVLYDFSFMAPGDPGLRSKLQKLTNKELLVQIEKAGYDLTSIDTRNNRRLIRLIESEGQKPKSSQLRSSTLVVGLRLPRSQLRANIEKRVEAMFARGLKQEAKELAGRYGWESEPMKGIGYREFRDYFDGKTSLAQTRRKIVKSTLDLAKRQRTWFKRRTEIVWIEDHSMAENLVKKFLSV